jgi:uncharacterized cupredoxin-like copper-binding protein
MDPRRARRPAFLLASLGVALTGCADPGPAVPPSFVAGSSTVPREVNIIAREYRFDPSPVELVPGETVLLHVVDAGLDVHEVVIGDAAVQDAWQVAEAATADGPPGPTPVVSVPPGVAGLRIVVRSGERVDVRWTVPSGAVGLVVGCHIPGHWARGMHVPVRLVVPGG